MSEVRTGGHCCPWWFAYTFDNVFRLLFQRPNAILGPYVRPGMTVLDLGCGMGFFSLAAARMVGDSGRVISVDLQQEMLDVLMRRARRRKIAGRIEARRCSATDIGLHGPVDFALASWMMHEVPDAAAYARQVAANLAPGGRFLLMEPKGHVDAETFTGMCGLLADAGLAVSETPRVGFSRAAVLQKPA